MRGEYAYEQQADSLTFGITPACAGNTFLTFLINFVSEDHPRMRGEYLFASAIIAYMAGSPPHARGILPKLAEGAVQIRITPACAGNTLK